MTRPMEFDQHSRDYQDKLARSISYSPVGHDFFTRLKANHLTRFVRARHPAGLSARLLDLGCGIGMTDEFLKNDFRNLVGLDISPESIARARERNPEVDYRVYDGRRAEFENGQFDIIFAICVLHHVPLGDRGHFFREAGRLLRDDGLLFVYEHNPLNPLTRFSVARCEFDRDANLVSASGTAGLLSANGFSPIRREYLGFLPIDSPWCRRLEERFLHAMPLGAQYVVIARKTIPG